MIDKTASISSILFEDRQLESIFERFGLERNLWNKNLEELCIEKKIDLNFVIDIASLFKSESIILPKLFSYSLENILDYLRKSHQYYLNTKLPEIEQSMVFLKKDFTSSHPILILLTAMFVNYKVKLEAHIRNEEELLFPYIDHLMNKELHLSKKFKNYSIQKFISSHSDPEDELKEIKDVIKQHSCLAEEVMPFHIFLYQIENFENDLSKHAQIEDLVMIPKAIALEKEINKKYHQII